VSGDSDLGEEDECRQPGRRRRGRQDGGHVLDSKHLSVPGFPCKCRAAGCFTSSTAVRRSIRVPMLVHVDFGSDRSVHGLSVASNAISVRRIQTRFLMSSCSAAFPGGAQTLTVLFVSLRFPCLVRASAHSRSFYHVTLTAGTRPANHATARTCDPRGPALARFGLFSFWERVAAHLQSWLARAGYLFLEMMSRSFLSLKTCGHFVAGFGSFCCRFWFSEVVRRLRPRHRGGA
jgi:hypothetical protein